MTKTLDVSIVLGPPPSRKRPITREQLDVLAAGRADVELRAVDTSTRGRKDLLLVDPTGQAPGELLFIDGRLQIRDPGPQTLQWMLGLAQALNGRVVSNTLKTYRSPVETYVHPDDEPARARLAASIREARKVDQAYAHPKPKRKWFGLWTLVLVPAAVATSELPASMGSPAGPVGQSAALPMPPVADGSGPAVPMAL